MTDPTTTEPLTERAGRAEWLDVEWTDTAARPEARPSAAPPLRPLRPRERRRGGPGDPRRLRRAAAVLALGVALVAVLALRGGPGGPARFGPVPATGEGPVGQVLLPGPWVLALDPGNTGHRRRLQRGGFAGTPVRLPYTINPAPIIGTDGSRNFQGSVAWLRTAVRVGHDGQYALRFSSVNHRATVWLDGHLLGAHIGTYLPFDMRFHATGGVHEVVVKVDWRNPAAMSRVGFHRTWFNFGGINGPVTIRPLGPSELLGPSVVTRLSSSGGASLTVGAIVHNNLAPRPLSVRGTLIHGDQRIAFTLPSHLVPRRGSVLESTVVHVDDPSLWQPGHPALYDLDLEVPGESGYHARVGLRQLTWGGGRLRINGHPVVLHGVSIQEDVPGRGDALGSGDQDVIVRTLQSLHANATRSQHPLDPGLLQRLDAAGILVWEGVGPVDPAGDWSANTMGLRRAAEERVRLTARAEATHPAIVAWNLANEVAGNGHRGGEAEYMQAMARELHRTDPGRMVAVDVWGEHPPRVAGPLYRSLDAIGLTNYEGWYQDTNAPPAVVGAHIRRNVEQMERTFPGKVLVVSEFGAEANASNPLQTPGGYAFQSNLLALHLDVYRTMPLLSGMLVWDLRDFAVAPTFAGGSIKHLVPGIQLVKGLNQKGLYDYYGRAKPAAGVVARAYAQMPEVG